MKSNIALWIAQVVLALLFLFAGGMKLVLPIEAMTDPVALPGALLRFIGVAEVLGAIGLVLPGLLRIRPGLTTLAACGLTIIMTGATLITAFGVNIQSALFPLFVGLIAASADCALARHDGESTDCRRVRRSISQSVRDEWAGGRVRTRYGDLFCRPAARLNAARSLRAILSH